jgi:hypothetical protein
MPMGLRALLLAAGVALLAGAAFAQPPANGLLKGHVKAGLYEQKTEGEVSGVPGLPPGQERHVETTRRCVTQAEADKGIELAPGCTLKSQNISGNTAQFAAECRDGATHAMKITTTPTGFTSEMKTTGKQRDGTPFSVSMRSESRYLGPCRN